MQKCVAWGDEAVERWSGVATVRWPLSAWGTRGPSLLVKVSVR